MSTTKTKAIGFLYTLTTNNETRQSWADNPDWDTFFDADDPLIDTFDDIGAFASGRRQGPENEKDWLTAVESMGPQIITGLFDGTLNSDMFSSPSSQRLAILISEIVYNADARAQYLKDPQSYIDQIPSASDSDVDFSEDLKNHLVEFGQLVQGAQTDEAKSYLTEVLNSDLVAQYMKEQSLIW